MCTNPVESYGDNFAVGCAGYQRLHSQKSSRQGLSRTRMDRRGMLQMGFAATSGLWLTSLAEQLSRAAEGAGGSRPKSLLMLWLQGGPSQLETFDPHPGSFIGGDTKSIPTTISGYEIADTLPATAEQMHHATLVRSVISKEGDHERATYHLKTGWRPDPTLQHPSIGSIICHQSESNIEIPRHISILASQAPARGGYLGPQYDAFQIGDPAEGVPNLKPRVDAGTLEQRRGPLLQSLEAEFQRGRMQGLNRHRTLHETATLGALTMMNSQQLSAFDVQSEGETVVRQFGDTPFGRGCLAAVRLLSSGVRCVEVELGGWDSHINNHELQSGQAKIMDRALAATLSELAARDMLENTIVFCGGEFGRTPRINAAGGRDHWPHGFSTLLAGGKFRRGYVHGATASNPDRKLLERQEDVPLDPSKLTEKIVSVPDLHATLLSALDIDHETEMMTPIGRPLKWSDGHVVQELLS